MTETVDHLDVGIRELIELLDEIKTIIGETKKGATPYFCVCFSKFQTAYLKLNNSEGFRDMFQTFHTKFRNEYCHGIYTKDSDDEIEINDEFFLHTHEYTLSGEIKKVSATAASGTKKRSFASKPALKGPVIYFDTEDKIASGVCLPIGEFYRTCNELFDKMEKQKEDDTNIRLLPTRLLFLFYNVIYRSIGDVAPGTKIIKENIRTLAQTIADLSEGEETQKKDTGPFSIIGDIVGKLTGGKNPIIPGGEGVGKFINSVVDGSSNEISTVFNSVAEKLNESTTGDEPPNLGTVLGNVADVFKTKEVNESFGKIQSQIQSLTSGEMAPPTAKSSGKSNTVVSTTASVNDDDADEQE